MPCGTLVPGEGGGGGNDNCAHALHFMYMYVHKLHVHVHVITKSSFSENYVDIGAANVSVCVRYITWRRGWACTHDVVHVHVILSGITFPAAYHM